MTTLNPSEEKKTSLKIVDFFKQILGRISPSSKFLFLFGILSFVMLFLLEKYYWQNSWSIRAPDFSVKFLIRTIAIAISVLALLRSLTINQLFNKTPKPEKCESHQRISIWIMLGIAIFFVLLFIFSPEVFQQIQEEDRTIEWASFVCSIVGSVIFFGSFLRTFSGVKVSLFIRIMLALFSLVLFVLAMEEISWGQRVFGFNTPDFFKSNTQEEINFHNFYSEYSDTLFYTCLLILLAVLPFLRFNFSDLFSNDYFYFFIPTPCLIISGAIPFAFNYNYWNIIFTQIWFFSSIMILLIIAILNRDDYTKNLLFISATLIVIIQGLFLLHDKNYPVPIRGQIGEYKEFLSQMALLIYSYDVYSKIRKSKIRFVAEK